MIKKLILLFMLCTLLLGARNFGDIPSSETGWPDGPPASGYTDEQAQDAVGTILLDSDTIDFTYDDPTPTITGIVKTGSISDGHIANNAVSYAKMQDVTATDRVIGRSSAGAGDPQEITFSDAVQDFSQDTFANDQIWVADSATAGTPRTIPNCTDTGGNHLNYTQSSNTFSCGTSSSGGGGGVIRVTQTTDVATTSSSVYSALSGLSISVAATTNYQIMCRFLTSTAVGTTGLQLRTTGPASPTEITIARRYYNNSTTALTVLTSTAFNSASTDDGAAGSCSTVRCLNEVDLFFVNGSNAGTVAFAIQSEVNTSNVTLRRGSYCDYRTF